MRSTLLLERARTVAHFGGKLQLVTCSREGPRELVAFLLRELELQRAAGRLQVVETMPDTLVVEAGIGLRALRHARAGGIRLPPRVLSGQPASGERAVGREAQPVFGAELQDALFRLPVEERVRVLHPLEAWKALALRDRQ